MMTGPTPPPSASTLPIAATACMPSAGAATGSVIVVDLSQQDVTSTTNTIANSTNSSSNNTALADLLHATGILAAGSSISTSCPTTTMTTSHLSSQVHQQNVSSSSVSLNQLSVPVTTAVPRTSQSIAGK